GHRPGTSIRRTPSPLCRLLIVLGSLVAVATAQQHTVAPLSSVSQYRTNAAAALDSEYTTLLTSNEAAIYRQRATELWAGITDFTITIKNTNNVLTSGALADGKFSDHT